MICTCLGNKVVLVVDNTEVYKVSQPHICIILHRSTDNVIHIHQTCTHWKIHVHARCMPLEDSTDSEHCTCACNVAADAWLCVSNNSSAHGIIEQCHGH